MQYVLASGPVTPWEQALATGGQIAAIILVLELLLFVVIALALNAVLTLASAWVREKAELVKKLRPVVDSVNATTEAAIKGTPPPAGAVDTIKLPVADVVDSITTVVRTVAQIPAQANAVEEKIEQGTDRVAYALIEFRARTVMVQGIVKAFFLPGLTTRQRRLPAGKSPGVKMLPEERSPEGKTAVQAGNGRAELVTSGSGSGSQPARTTGT